MEGKRFIRTLRLQNFLSYGSEGEEIELQPLNVLIGANATGKSNLISAIEILKATPIDLTSVIRKGGGVNDFLWKGEKDIPTAEIEATLDSPLGNMPLRYRLNFTAVNSRLEIVDEAIENERPYPDEDDVYFYYRYQQGHPVLNFKTAMEGQRSQRSLHRNDLLPDRSILSQLKDPEQYPELTYLGNKLSSIALYRNWHIGRNVEPSLPQKTDLPYYPLLEDASNLGLVLNNLQYQLGTKRINEMLEKLYEEAEEIIIKIYGGTVQIFIREEKLSQPIPANRLSDGTLHYLFLMALLLDPSPPPLLCIEEPELGLHPDMMSTIAEMLIAASERTQLIVTTHSEALLSSLSPEAVVVCDRDYMGSHLRRLEPNRLKKSLENSSLGDLWRMGEIGGNIW